MNRANTAWVIGLIDFITPSTVSTVRATSGEMKKRMAIAGKAAFPPVKAILDWISVKPILPRPDDEGNMQKLRPKSLAFLIGRKIQQHGIEPHPALHRTIEELDKIYHEKLSAALGHDVSNYIRKIISTK
jgi:hypothetical protein